VEVRQTAALHFSNLQVVQLGDDAQVGLSDTTLGRQQATDELNRIVPQPRRVSVPQDRAAIVKALLTQWTTQFDVVVTMSTCTGSGPAVDAL
jgi:hypothetical protein